MRKKKKIISKIPLYFARRFYKKEKFCLICTAIQVSTGSDDMDTQVRVGLTFQMFQVSQANVVNDKCIVSRNTLKSIKINSD